MYGTLVVYPWTHMRCPHRRGAHARAPREPWAHGRDGGVRAAMAASGR